MKEPYFLSLSFLPPSSAALMLIDQNELHIHLLLVFCRLDHASTDNKCYISLYTCYWHQTGDSGLRILDKKSKV